MRFWKILKKNSKSKSQNFKKHCFFEVEKMTPNDFFEIFFRKIWSQKNISFFHSKMLKNMFWSISDTFSTNFFFFNFCEEIFVGVKKIPIFTQNPKFAFFSDIFQIFSNIFGYFEFFKNVNSSNFFSRKLFCQKFYTNVD